MAVIGTRGADPRPKQSRSLRSGAPGAESPGPLEVDGGGRPAELGRSEPPKRRDPSTEADALDGTMLGGEGRATGDGGSQVVASVMVKRVAALPGRHVYIYGPEDEVLGHLTFDVHLGRLYPSDAAGARTDTAFLSLDGKSFDRGTLSDFEQMVFVKACAGIMKRVQAGEEPPETAHRFFY